MFITPTLADNYTLEPFKDTDLNAIGTGTSLLVYNGATSDRGFLGYNTTTVPKDKLITLINFTGRYNPSIGGAGSVQLFALAFSNNTWNNTATPFGNELDNEVDTTFTFVTPATTAEVRSENFNGRLAIGSVYNYQESSISIGRNSGALVGSIDLNSSESLSPPTYTIFVSNDTIEKSLINITDASAVYFDFESSFNDSTAYNYRDIIIGNMTNFGP